MNDEEVRQAIRQMDELITSTGALGRSSVDKFFENSMFITLYKDHPNRKRRFVIHIRPWRGTWSEGTLESVFLEETPLCYEKRNHQTVDQLLAWIRDCRPTKDYDPWPLYSGSKKRNKKED